MLTSFHLPVPTVPQGALTAATAGPKKVKEDPTKGTYNLARAGWWSFVLAPESANLPRCFAVLGPPAKLPKLPETSMMRMKRKAATGCCRTSWQNLFRMTAWRHWEIYVAVQNEDIYIYYILDYILWLSFFDFMEQCKDFPGRHCFHQWIFVSTALCVKEGHRSLK